LQSLVPCIPDGGRQFAKGRHGRRATGVLAVTQRPLQVPLQLAGDDSRGAHRAVADRLAAPRSAVEHAADGTADEDWDREDGAEPLIEDSGVVVVRDLVRGRVVVDAAREPVAQYRAAQATAGHYAQPAQRRPEGAGQPGDAQLLARRHRLGAPAEDHWEAARTLQGHQPLRESPIDDRRDTIVHGISYQAEVKLKSGSPSNRWRNAVELGSKKAGGRGQLASSIEFRAKGRFCWDFLSWSVMARFLESAGACVAVGSMCPFNRCESEFRFR